MRCVFDRTHLEHNSEDGSTTTLIFEYERGIKTGKTSIIVQYVDVLKDLKGRPQKKIMA